MARNAYFIRRRKSIDDKALLSPFFSFEFTNNCITFHHIYKFVEY